MTTDIAIVWDNGLGDIVPDGIDMLTDNTLTTAVIISLFTDRRAQDSDELPGTDGDRRGWWGDSYRDRPIGSRLWLLSREKTLQSVLGRAAAYALEALQWLKSAGRVTKIAVYASRVRQNGQEILLLEVELTLPDGAIHPFTFKATFSGV
ncbi:phage GP46 family protein [Erwinia sp. HR93]|uniref:phage GP46 family protein n=1 Tax=Erwinia sp. HR93 TaxID=3094840 RepID=UPI002ADEE01E|nr:phage GP46 family protein [Erwinia sp. HR93]MEA1063949.1 phage GP46 family protein [Erwinia sp. HR93]MEA1065829.1 phage GP46 family protein [Erwinia sp. HR93]